MPIAKCDRCGKIFDKVRSSICPACEPLEEDDYEIVRKALVEKPGQSAEDIAEQTGVGLDCVLRLLASGRIETTSANLGIKCGRCGAPAISISKKLCESCLQKLNAEIAIQQSKIKLPKRKGIELGTALNVFDKDEEGDKGGVKYNR
ncbi:MAG: hypothetical protein K1Y02_14915 [Candidatus Hydrogenedentes bacterium]|nr:hypothetical protein [Candidatus Hydrogenedentota bacterium]